MLEVVPVQVFTGREESLLQGGQVRVGVADAAAVGEPGDVHLPVAFQQVPVLLAVLGEQVAAEPRVVAPPRHAVGRLLAHRTLLSSRAGPFYHDKAAGASAARGPKARA